MHHVNKRRKYQLLLMLRVDVVTLPDQNGEFGEVLLQIFHSDGKE